VRATPRWRTRAAAAGIALLALLLFPLSFVLVELVATPLYAASRNVLAIAALESAWLAWLQAASLPILW
jgi:hypothetical protein